MLGGIRHDVFSLLFGIGLNRICLYEGWTYVVVLKRRIDCLRPKKFAVREDS